MQRWTRRPPLGHWKRRAFSDSGRWYRNGQTHVAPSKCLCNVRYFAHSSRHASFQTVPTLASWERDTFQQRAFIPKLPALLPQDGSKQPPASRSWLETDHKRPSLRTLNFAYLTKYGDTSVPLEFTQTDSSGRQTFERFHAPLKLFLEWMRQNQATTGASPPTPSPSPRLYLAQCQISDLPHPLQADLPTPEVVLKAGKGDIYDANIWIGSPPTYTPLHRDPNPNFFLQLAGTKIVRLFPPEVGNEIFGAVQAKLGRNGSAAFRGEEMMQGEEREMLANQVWGDGDSSQLAPGLQVGGYQATVEQGKALFIPLGWWHSIRSVGTGTTASVNWWFR
ncbi:hypothetical protein GJ744_009736 [Endocarpon pusillum]|uniref:JmjC domain-containing protein n=1 Tax=Endocarpon pusillum TaxID=364733 RepID=A0A8H7APZ2_9EURO|nr:hypothetical protein GJ744_009736 [Endocarpon pusillum]